MLAPCIFFILQRCSVDDEEYPSSKPSKQEEEADDKPSAAAAAAQGDAMSEETEAPEVSRACARDYPAELQSRALEQVNSSPRVAASLSKVPITSPRPSPRIRLNLRSNLGKVHISFQRSQKKKFQSK
ncbi:IQ domain-containing protein IQM4-like [Phragmites australis]|uniref:IQ domain-containing protein IQM4-like n=1 Tax=Phragmites australis TaxID=29695 RepID=UPI002D79552C|nr:IQ domain-containing protein IQM4-like [Phragmites australis]